MSAKTRNLSLVFLALIFLLSGCRSTGTSSGKAVETDSVESAAIRISPKDADAAEPAVAADGAGNLFVVYVLHKPNKGADVFMQKVDRDGKPTREPVRVDPVDGSAKAWKGDPPTVAIGGDNAIYVGWTRTLTDPAAQGNDLMLSKSIDGGRSFGEPVKVNDDTKPASHGLHSLAVDNEGGVYVAWLDERNIQRQTPDMDMAVMHHEAAEPNSEIFYSVSTDGGKTFSANKKLASDACPCCKTNLVASPEGIVYASWRQVLPGGFRHIAISRSEDNGASFSASVIVSDDKWKIDACPVSGAAMAIDSTGALNVMWYAAGSEGQPGMYVAKSTDHGKTFNPRTLVSTETMSGTPVLLGDRSGTLLLATAKVGNAVLIGQWDNSAKAIEQSTVINDASLPAAAVAGEKLFTAYVQNQGEKKEVWLRRIVSEAKPAV